MVINMKLVLKHLGYDSWDRPVYEDSKGRLYVDVDPIGDRQSNICTKCNNEFDGEPDCPVSAEFEFAPHRSLW